MEPGWFQITLKAILFDRSGRLLILKDAESQAGDFPGGRLGAQEVYEPWNQALGREIREELGAALHVQLETEPFYFFPHRILNGGHPALCFCYRGALQAGEIVLSAEHDWFDWVTPDDFDPAPLFRGTMLSSWSEITRPPRFANQSGSPDREREK